MDEKIPEKAKCKTDHCSEAGKPKFFQFCLGSNILKNDVEDASRSKK